MHRVHVPNGRRSTCLLFGVLVFPSLDFGSARRRAQAAVIAFVKAHLRLEDPSKPCASSSADLRRR